MKKALMVLVGFCIALLLFSTDTLAAASPAPIRVLVDGQELTFTDVQPMIVDGRTLVPVRGVFEHIGFSVQWNDVTNTATLTRQNILITVRRGDNFLAVNGQRLTPDVPPQIVGGRFMLPLRAVADAAGVFVDWDGANRTVIILTGDVPAPVTLTNSHISFADLNNWIAYYIFTGGPNEMELEMLHYVNIERARVGAPPLVLCPVLSMAARFKSHEMVDLRYFAHDSPVYGHFANIPRALFGAEHIRGENLFRRVANPYVSRNLVLNLEDVSFPHWENMVNPNHTTIGIGAITAMGVGVNFDGTPITDRYASMITHMFGVDPAPLPPIVQVTQLDPSCCDNCALGVERLAQLRDDTTTTVVRFSSHGLTLYINEEMFNIILADNGPQTEEFFHWFVGGLLIRGETMGSVYIVVTGSILGYPGPAGSQFIAELEERALTLEEAIRLFGG